MFDGFNYWLDTAGLPFVTLTIVASLFAAGFVGIRLHRRFERPAALQDTRSANSEESYAITAVLGLLALLMGFTFSLAIDRYDVRRKLVIDEANAIGTAYLRAQLLAAPHRERISSLLARYVDNRIELANAAPGTATAALARNDSLLVELWAAQVAAIDSMQHTPLATSSVEAMNAVIDLDSERKAARRAHVPTEVFAVLIVYLVFTAGLLGYVLRGSRGRALAVSLLFLFTLALLLVIDLDRPSLGGIRESQRPMEDLQAGLKAQPPAVFDRWRQTPP